MRLRPAALRLVIASVAAGLCAFGTAVLAAQPVPPGPAGSPAAAAPHSAAPPRLPGWVGTWAAAMTDAPHNRKVAGGDPTYTVRNVVRISVGGTGLRLRLSNAFGEGDAAFGPVTVGLADPARPGGIVGDAAPVTFGGAPAAGVAAAGTVTSDPVPFVTGDGATLVVSIHVPEPPPRASRHVLALHTGYVAAGDHAADTGADAYDRTSTSWWFLTGVDVAGSGARGTVVAFGDSITDGHGSTFGADRRWPDLLAARLERAGAGDRLAVVNTGISGNRLLAEPGEDRTKRARPDERGRPGVDRAGRDTAEPPATRTVVLMLGINDIRLDASPTADELWSGYERIVAAAHRRGVRVIGSTLLPIGGTDRFTEEREKVREEVNDRIRAGGLFDGYVDADAAVRDPDDPTRMREDYQAGDWLHPSDAGYRAIADAVDLTIL